MPVLMRGGGGGKKIKDATAVSSDVAKGKVFYNNLGRQVGSSNSAIKEYRFKITKGEYNATRESFKWSTLGAWNLSYHIANYDRPSDSQYLYFNTADSYETMPAFFSLNVSHLKIEHIYGIRYQPPLYKEPIDFICKYSPISLPQGGMQIYFSEGVRCRYRDDSTYESYVDFELLSICLTKNIIKMFTTVSGGFSVQKVVPDKDMEFVLYYK